MYYSLRSDITGLTTFGVPATAKEFFRIDKEEEIEDLYARGVLETPGLLILGGGSNLLFVNDPQGPVIHLALKGIKGMDNTAEEAVVSCAAGESWDDLVEATVNAGFYGLENLSLIPGSVGAAPVQNIGAYGIELKDVFHSLRAFDMKDGSWKEFDHSDCVFEYRSSVFKTKLKGRMIITNVRFRLSRKGALNTSYGNIADELKEMECSMPGPKDVRQAVIRVRRSKLPDPAELGNAGSFFKNPAVEKDIADQLSRENKNMPAFPQPDGRVKLAAGWLIEQCGWKGYREGNVGVHSRQALVLVNHGGASGAEVLALANKLIQSVYERFGVVLEPEVNIIGGPVNG